MPFCPNCRSQYRAGFETCADCGLELVEKLEEPKPEPEPEPEPEPRAPFTSLKRLCSAASVQQAEMLRLVLEDNGVPAAVEGGGMGFEAFEASRSTFWVRVPDEHLSRGQEILREYMKEHGTQAPLVEHPESGFGGTVSERFVWFVAFGLWVLAVLLFVPSWVGDNEYRLLVACLIAMPLVILAAFRVLRRKPLPPGGREKPDDDSPRS